MLLFIQFYVEGEIRSLHWLTSAIVFSLKLILFLSNHLLWKDILTLSSFQIEVGSDDCEMAKNVEIGLLPLNRDHWST